MAKYDKPNDTVNVVWAQDALSTDFHQPSDEDIRIGWEQEKPPYQVENWSMNKLHRMVAYLNQMGIPEWDSETEYQQDKSYVQASDGRIYYCIATNRNRNPSEGANSDWWIPFRGDRMASNTREGVTRYATVEEVENGERDDVAVTPYSLGEGRVGSPVGTIIIWPGTTPPEGYLECNGAGLNISLYRDLYDVIGTTYGSYGSNFRVPDLRGEFVRGWDHGRGVDAGRSLGSHQGYLVQSHNHSGNTNNAGWHSHGASTGGAGNHRHAVYGSSSDGGGSGRLLGADGDGWNFNKYTNYSGNHTHSVSIAGNGTHSHSFNTNHTGGGETRPRNVAMMYCIKYE